MSDQLTWDHVPLIVHVQLVDLLVVSLSRQIFSCRLQHQGRLLLIRILFRLGSWLILLIVAFTQLLQLSLHCSVVYTYYWLYHLILSIALICYGSPVLRYTSSLKNRPYFRLSSPRRSIWSICIEDVIQLRVLQSLSSFHLTFHGSLEVLWWNQRRCFQVSIRPTLDSRWFLICF